MIRQCLTVLALTISLGANAAYLVESSPGIVTGIGDLHIGEEFYNVDFEAIDGVFSTFGGSEFFWGDDSSALAAAAAVSHELNEMGIAMINNIAPSDTSSIAAVYLVWTPTDTLIGAFLVKSEGNWRTIFIPQNSFSYSGHTPGFGTAWSVSEIPIPAAAWLFGSALFGLGAIKRKANSRNGYSC